MLLLEGVTDVGGVQVLADHVSPTTFHYLPGLPRPVRRGSKPGIQLIRYRAPRGGGLLLAEIDLSHDPATLAEVRRTLERTRGPVDLVPVAFKSGSVRVTALGVDVAPQPGARGVLAERVLTTVTPSLFGGARAIVSASLSAEAASLVHSALQDGSLPVTIVYELAFEGLRLARGARATVRYDMAYDYLRTKFRGDALVFKADLDRETESLRRSGLIDIEDVDYLGNDPATLARRADELRAELASIVESSFFTPSLSAQSLGAAASIPESPVARAMVGSGSMGAAFLLKSLVQRETGTLSYDLTVSRVATRTIAPQGMLAGFARADVAILDVDADDAPPRTITAFVPPGADWSGVDAVELSFTQSSPAVGVPAQGAPRTGATPAGAQPREAPAGPAAAAAAAKTVPLGTVVLTPARTEGMLAAPGGTDIHYTRRVLSRPEPEGLGAPPSETAAPVPALLTSDFLPVDPAALSGRRTITVTLEPGDPAAKVSARGSLDAGGRSRPFVLDAARTAVTVPVWGQAPVDCSLAVQLDQAVASTGTRTLLPGERLVVASLPAGRRQLVVVELTDPLQRIETVLVEIEDGSGARRLVKVDAASPRESWSGMRAASGRAPYRWSSRTVMKNGRSIESGWRDGAGSLLVVGDTDIRTSVVELVLLGAPATSVGAEISVTSLAAPQGLEASISAVIEPPFQTRVVVPFTADAGARRYRIAGTLYLEDRQLPIGPLESADDVCLVPLALV